MTQLIVPHCKHTCSCYMSHSVSGHSIYVLGGRRYSEKKDVLEVDRYSIKKRKWTSRLTLGDGDFANVDCCVLRVPATNPHFTDLSRAVSRQCAREPM